MKKLLVLLLLTLPLFPQSKPQSESLHSEEITYQEGQTTFQCHLYYPNNLKGKHPGVLVLPEWWGCNDYCRHRAQMLAALGYVALAVDMYGEGKQADNPKEASAMATPFYKNPEMGINRLKAAIEKLKTIANVDANRIAAIGYCFGGAQVLNAARKGVDMKAVVSFHGGLKGVPATPNTTKARILVCHGLDDSFIPEEDVQWFKQNLDSLHVAYEFKTYPGTHAFTNPASTESGKKFNLPIAYNEESDKASWKDACLFLKESLK